MAPRHPAPEFSAIYGLPGDSTPLQIVKTLGISFRQIEEYLRSMQAQLDDLNIGAGALNRITTTGLSGPDLKQGHLTYQRGGVWQRASSKTSTAFAQGVAIEVLNGQATVQSALFAHIAVTQTLIPMGATLWLGGDGQATTAVPDPSDANTQVIQEVGYTLENPREGRVFCSIHLRITPEIV